MNTTGTIRKLFPITTALALAAIIAGCGGTTPTGGKPTPKPSASAKASPTPAALTLAEASSPNYTAKFPLVPCSTLSPAAQSAWGPLLAGSSVGKCAPANYLATDVPQGVTVINEDHAISQAQANAYGQALVNTLAWYNFGVYDDALPLINQIGQAGGALYPVYQWLQAGGRFTSPSPGQEVFPEKIYLIPLTPSEQKVMLNTTATFALITSYNQTPYSGVWTPPGQSFTNYSTTPQVFTGSIRTSPALGTYFAVAVYSNDCAIGPDASMCQSVGVS